MIHLSRCPGKLDQHMMLDRKQEIPFFKSEHQRLEAEIQPALPLFH